MIATYSKLVVNKMNCRMVRLSKTYNDEENVVASHVEHSVDND